MITIGDKVKYKEVTWEVYQIEEKSDQPHVLLKMLHGSPDAADIGWEGSNIDASIQAHLKIDPNCRYIWLESSQAVKEEKEPPKEDKLDIPAEEKLIKKLHLQKKSAETTAETEVKNMESTETFFGKFKPEATEATYRVAGTQITKATKSAILALMADKGANSNAINAMRDLMEHEFGSAVIAVGLGHILEHIPAIGADPRVQKIAKEFRVSGMATGGNVVVDSLLEYVSPAVTQALSMLPAENATQARIEPVTAPAVTAPPAGEEEETEQEERAKPKVMAVSA